MELNLKNLAPLLQCTSINRCALFITSKRKKYYYIKFLSLLLLKKYFFLFLSFLSLSPVSLLSSSFFIFQSSILIKPASLLSPPKPSADRRSKPSPASTTPQHRSLIEAQPSTDHSSLPSADRRSPLFLRCWDQGEVVRRSKARTWLAPLLTSSKQRAEPTNPSPPVTTKVFPSIPSFSLKCIFFLGGVSLTFFFLPLSPLLQLQLF